MAKHAHTTPTFTPHVTPVTSKRRTLLAAAASAVVMGGGITAGAAASVADLTSSSLDAELIVLCSKFDELERRRQDACNGARTLEEDDAADVICAEVQQLQGPILDRICGSRAFTVEGISALAASLVLWDAGELFIKVDDRDALANERLTAVMLRSALAGRS